MTVTAELNEVAWAFSIWLTRSQAGTDGCEPNQDVGNAAALRAATATSREHTANVLRDYAGVDEKQLNALRSRGIV